MGCKDGWCVGLTTLPTLCADCLEIWEPQPPGTLRACPGLQWDCFTFLCIYIYIYIYIYIGREIGFGGIGVACWPSVPVRSRRIFQGEKFLSTPSFGGEVKPSVPCRRFAACKRALNLRGSQNLVKITGQISRPQFHLSLLGSLASLRTYRYLAAKDGTSKGGGKQRQTTPKHLP